MTPGVMTVGNIALIYASSGSLAGTIETVADAPEEMRGYAVSLADLEAVRRDDIFNLARLALVAERAGVHIVLSDLNPALRKILEKLEIEGIFTFEPDGDSAVAALREMIAGEDAAGEMKAPADGIDEEFISGFIAEIKTRIDAIMPRTRRITKKQARPKPAVQVSVIALKNFTRKALKDPFHIDLLRYFAGSSDEVSEGKEIAAAFGLKEGDIRRALGDLAKAGIIKKVSGRLFGGTTWTYEPPEDVKPVIAAILQMAGTEKGKRDVTSWIKRGN